jgi:phytoene dehydrogenase-like protein
MGVQIRDALLAIAVKRGVRVVTDCEVRSIDCETSRVRMVHCADGGHYTADTVLCNADVATALKMVDHPKATSKAQDVANKAYSASVIEYRWSVKRCGPICAACSIC